METEALQLKESKQQRPVPTQCPMTAALNAIGGKWSLICLFWLDRGPRRFNELRRLMPDISHKVLTATLRNLEEEGMIDRTVYAEVPSRVEYAISNHGESARPLIEAVRNWGHCHIDWKKETGISESLLSTNGE